MASNSRSTAQFRRDTVRLALSSNRPRREIADELGIGASTLTRWIRQERDFGESTARPVVGPAAALRTLSAELIEGGDFIHDCGVKSRPDAIGTGVAHAAHVDAETGMRFVRLANGPQIARSFGKTDGYSLRTSDAFEIAANGRRVVVSAVVRAAEAPNARFALAYSTNEVGNSGWHWQNAGPDWAVYSFDYAVPVMKQGLGDFIAILPEPKGQPGIDLLLVVARLL